MLRNVHTVVLALLVMLAAACSAELAGPPADQLETNVGPATLDQVPTATSANAGKPQPHVTFQRYALVPPACFPACPQIARERTKGWDILIRRRDRAVNKVYLTENIERGNAYVYAVTPFNNPENCEFTEDRFLGVPYPCRSNGPLNRLDGLDPATGFYVATYGGRVARRDRIYFRFDLVRDTPTEVIVGEGVTNAAGMMFYAGVMDKGPALPEDHPLRWAQLNTLKGGCQGPPAFGPLPCRWVHIAAHAPRSDAGPHD